MAQTYSLWQAVDAFGQLCVRTHEMAQAIARQPGPPGEPGKDGPPGKIEKVKAWREGVFYVGDVVTKDGSTYQALRDTGHEPPHEEDWACLAARGNDGRGVRIRGIYQEGETYEAGDVVACNSGSLVALKDHPGRCPGDDWQLWAARGKPGERGGRGERGERGERGADGASIIGGTFDTREMKLVLERSDGGMIAVDLYDFALALKGA